MKDDDTDPLFLEALHWFALMQDEKVPDEDRLRFSAWLSADPANEQAYARAEKLWDRFEVVKPEYERVRRADAFSRRSVLLGVGAVLALGAGTYLATRPGVGADYRTGVGERRVFTLADGSTAELGSSSALSVHYGEGERRLVLHKGQGFFSVAADAVRPFVVEAGSGTVQALGTRFDIKLTEEDATVAVIEHSVLVTPSGHAPVRVEEGWQVSYDLDGTAPPRRIDLESAQAWRRDRIVFEDVPLRRVLKELERYRRGRIILVDDRVGDIPVTAIFETKRAGEALRIISETLPVRVMDAAGVVAFVYRR